MAQIVMHHFQDHTQLTCETHCEILQEFSTYIGANCSFFGSLFDSFFAGCSVFGEVGELHPLSLKAWTMVPSAFNLSLEWWRETKLRTLGVLLKGPVESLTLQ
jgi:hypothetical protein